MSYEDDSDNPAFSREDVKRRNQYRLTALALTALARTREKSPFFGEEMVEPYVDYVDMNYHFQLRYGTSDIDPVEAARITAEAHAILRAQGVRIHYNGREIPEEQPV